MVTFHRHCLGRKFHFYSLKFRWIPLLGAKIDIFMFFLQKRSTILHLHSDCELGLDVSSLMLYKEKSCLKGYSLVLYRWIMAQNGWNWLTVCGSNPVRLNFFFLFFLFLGMCGFNPPWFFLFFFLHGIDFPFFFMTFRYHNWYESDKKVPDNLVYKNVQ